MFFTNMKYKNTRYKKCAIYKKYIHINIFTINKPGYILCYINIYTSNYYYDYLTYFQK